MFSATLRMIGRLIAKQVVARLPGLRGMPAVTMRTSAPAQSAQLEVPVMLRVVAEDGAVLLEVERLALGEVLLLGDVEEDDVAELLARGQRGELAADVAGADECDLVPAGHRVLLVGRAIYNARAASRNDRRRLASRFVRAWWRARARR